MGWGMRNVECLAIAVVKESEVCGGTVLLWMRAYGMDEACGTRASKRSARHLNQPNTGPASGEFKAVAIYYYV